MSSPLTEKGNSSGEDSIPLSVSFWREGTTLYLSLFGEVDMHTIAVLRDAVTDGLQDNSCVNIVADMSRVPFVDSTGYGVFLDAMQTLRMRGGRVYLGCCLPSVKRMIAVARLNRVFAIYDSVEEVRELLSHPSGSV